jgi:hypothetical protein
VVYSLSTGDGIGMDVEREWLEMTIGGVIAALDDIKDIDAHGVKELNPDEHCVFYPCALVRPHSLVDRPDDHAAAAQRSVIDPAPAPHVAGANSLTARGVVAAAPFTESWGSPLPVNSAGLRTNQTEVS